MEARRMRWAGHVAQIETQRRKGGKEEEKRYAYVDSCWKIQKERDHEIGGWII
jgi:hypothetical protein